MIPKKIHYCWFSGKAFPEKIASCIESWKKFLPDYELVLWDLEKAKSIDIPWVAQALGQKKWAFAADAVRLYALKNEGGIYLDSDVEVVKSFEPLMDRKYFFGYENGSKRIEGAVLGAEKNDPAIEAALQYYCNRDFDYNESAVNEMVLPNVLAEAFATLPQSAAPEIFPESYFSPKSFMDGKIRTTPDTYCIHHFTNTWRPDALRKGIRRRQKLYEVFPSPIAKALSIPLSLWTNLQNLGFAGTFKKALKTITRS